MQREDSGDMVCPELLLWGAHRRCPISFASVIHLSDVGQISGAELGKVFL